MLLCIDIDRNNIDHREECLGLVARMVSSILADQGCGKRIRRGWSSQVRRSPVGGIAASNYAVRVCRRIEPQKAIKRASEHSSAGASKGK